MQLQESIIWRRKYGRYKERTICLHPEKKNEIVNNTQKPLVHTETKEPERSFEESLKAMEKQVASVKGGDVTKEKSPVKRIEKKAAERVEKTSTVETSTAKVSVSKECVSEVRTSKLKTSKSGEFFTSMAEAFSNCSVPTDYQKIVIEQIQQTEIKECPALIWKDESKLYVLPLLKKSKIYQWPLTSTSIVLYERLTEQEVEQRYEQLFKSTIVAEFENEVPVYFYNE